MSVSLSPIYNGYQSFLATGLPNSGGYLYTYAAGTSTPQETFTTSAGNVQNANPMQFNAGGFPTSAIWLTDGQAYKFIITDALGNNVQIFDNIEGSWTTGNLFAAINGSSSEDFSTKSLSVSGSATVNGPVTASGAITAGGGITAGASITAGTSGASGSTQVPQMTQVLGKGATSWPAGNSEASPTTHTNITNAPVTVFGSMNWSVGAGSLTSGMYFIDIYIPASTTIVQGYGYYDGSSQNMAIPFCFVVPPSQSWTWSTTHPGSPFLEFAWREY